MRRRGSYSGGRCLVRTVAPWLEQFRRGRPQLRRGERPCSNRGVLHREARCWRPRGATQVNLCDAGMRPSYLNKGGWIGFAQENVLTLAVETPTGRTPIDG